MNTTEHKKATKAFFEKWSVKEVSERGGYQIFWIELLQNVLGDENASNRISAEEKVRVDNHTNFIDIYLPDVKVIIEQKKRGIVLDAKAKQSDGSFLTPFEQAKKYNDDLRQGEKAGYIITSNFDEIWVYDMNPKVRGVYEPVKILLSEIFKYSEFLKNVLVEQQTTKVEIEKDISFKAGSIIGKIYNALYKQYEKVYNPLTDEILRDLNKLCVRLVFCFYAEDTDLFPEYNYFQHYMDKISADKFRKELIGVFETLDTDYPNRDKFIEKALNDFPYVNGGLFDGKIQIPQFDEKLKQIVHEASVLDWSKISPSIFGAIFESTLNPETRRIGGMHYTTIENIHKVIDPLFLDDLKHEFEQIKKEEKNKKTNLENFQNKIASLKFLDPACGSGNFLTETYTSLRRLENEILKELNKNQKIFGTEGFTKIKVSISQFYGIEINDFAVDVAKAAMWIAENQMLRETLENVAFVEAKPLPLNANDNIVEANAIKIDWESVVPKNELNYIMGNPPFVGGMFMSKAQKSDMDYIFGKTKGVGELDYVCAWYKKAVEYVGNTNIISAFVSTNSICQGQQAVTLWKPLIENGVEIKFAYKTFRWDSEANIKAHVHCVIIGFSCDNTLLKPLVEDGWQSKTDNSPKVKPLGVKQKRLFENNKITLVSHINSYLLEAPDVFVESLSKPLCDVPPMRFGSMPRDGGGFVLNAEEREYLLKNEPLTEKWIKPYIGSAEFINNKQRWCLWLVDAEPKEIKQCPTVYKRIEFVRQFRLNSVAAGTRKFAETPTLFCQIAQPDSDYIIVPKVSSERRRYIPIGFMPKNIIASDLVFLIPNATIYHFGILTSNVHMNWTRTVCGRLKSDYRYSKDIVYNNFPWPTPTPEQKSKIEATAQAILDARALYPDSSLADLYDPLTMPVELRKAHEANDKAVLQAYGLPKNIAEADIVSHLMNLYKELTSKF